MDNKTNSLSFPVQVLLVSTFLMNIGTFAMMPFLVLYLAHTLHFPAWQVAAVLTITLICARVPPFAPCRGQSGERLATFQLWAERQQSDTGEQAHIAS